MADHGIGSRVRASRKAKGLSQQVVADLAGLSKSALSMYESGDRPLERLSTIDALAGALGVSRAWLLGLPEDPTSPTGARTHEQVERLRAALLDTAPGERQSPLDLLVSEAYRLGVELFHGQISAVTRSVPDVLVGLRAWSASGDEGKQTEALRGLVVATGAASIAAKRAGFADLAWIAADQGRHAAHRLSEPAWTGLADFYVSQALTPYASSLANAEHALATLEGHVGDDLTAVQVYGMLHLMAAFGCGVVGRSDDVRTHLTEARTLAQRTGDRTDLNLYFGPTNVAIWSLSIAVEEGEGGRAAEIGRRLDIRKMPSTSRQANYFIDLGRGYAQERLDSQAATAFLNAERIAPELVHHSPLVREATSHILCRAARASVPGGLRGFAQRIGAAP